MTPTSQVALLLTEPLQCTVHTGGAGRSSDGSRCQTNQLKWITPRLGVGPDSVSYVRDLKSVLSAFNSVHRMRSSESLLAELRAARPDGDAVNSTLFLAAAEANGSRRHGPSSSNSSQVEGRLGLQPLYDTVTQLHLTSFTVLN